MIHFRPYQNRAINAPVDYFVNGGLGNPLIGMPTGTGKSLVIAGFIKRMFLDYPQSRVLVATHVKELIEQNVAALKSIWASAPVGINSAGIGQRDTALPIIYAGVASIRNNVGMLGHRDIMFIDEAHLVSQNEDSMYQTVINELRQINPRLKVIGLTATLFRLGQGMLISGDSIFTDVCLDLTKMEEFNKFIEDYWLCPLIPKRMDFELDVSGIDVVAGDFNQRQLQVSVDQAVVTRRALLEARDVAANRRKWLVFAAGVPHAQHITEELNTLGVTAYCIHAKTPADERNRLLKAHKEGLFTALVNNSVLTTGYDDKYIDCIVDLGPTASPGRHVQKYGRGTRPVYHPSFTNEQIEQPDLRKQAFEAGGKRNCLVLDFAGNTRRLGPINDPVIPAPKGGSGTGEVPIKLCENCGAYNHISARVCCDCGEAFVFKVKTKSSADTVEIIRSNGELDVEIYDVDDTFYRDHIGKKSGEHSLKCVYFCRGGSHFNEWVHFESSAGLAKHRAHDWWRQRCPGDIPATVEEAMALIPQLRKPRKIKVLTGGRYPEIQEVTF